MPTLYSYASKDVRIHNYFSIRKGFQEEESLGNTAISSLIYQQGFKLHFGTHLCGHRRWGKLVEIYGRIR